MFKAACGKLLLSHDARGIDFVIRSELQVKVIFPGMDAREAAVFLDVDGSLLRRDFDWPNGTEGVNQVLIEGFQVSIALKQMVHGRRRGHVVPLYVPSATLVRKPITSPP